LRRRDEELRRRDEELRGRDEKAKSVKEALRQIEALVMKRDEKTAAVMPSVILQVHMCLYFFIQPYAQIISHTDGYDLDTDIYEHRHMSAYVPKCAYALISVCIPFY
jgi:hypothetical protein